ncbi:MAG: alpha/beta hydrolase [Deltaproteobacteria bacterium]|nr:alpha/beta hydrolase [Deltaproteobacteria bacterium]
MSAARPPKALVLESTFRSLASIAERFGVPRFLVLDPLDSEEAIRAFEGPVLVIHGTDDTLIPYAHGEALGRAAPHCEVLLLRGGHGTISRGDEYWSAIRRTMTSGNVL